MESNITHFQQLIMYLVQRAGVFISWDRPSEGQARGCMDGCFVFKFRLNLCLLMRSEVTLNCCFFLYSCSSDVGVSIESSRLTAFFCSLSFSA